MLLLGVTALLQAVYSPFNTSVSLQKSQKPAIMATYAYNGKMSVKALVDAAQDNIADL